jgi:DNA-directed RNA polymerase specialized sigma24 family protein
VPRKHPRVYLSALPLEPAAPEKGGNSDPPPAGVDIREAVGALKPELRQVIEHRYGLANGQEETLAAIGERLGLSRQAVQLREKKALTVLRAKFKVQGQV